LVYAYIYLHFLYSSCYVEAIMDSNNLPTITHTRQSWDIDVSCTVMVRWCLKSTKLVDDVLGQWCDSVPQSADHWTYWWTTLSSSSTAWGLLQVACRYNSPNFNKMILCITNVHILFMYFLLYIFFPVLTMNYLE